MRRYQTLIALNVSVFLLMIGGGMGVALLPQKIITLSGSVTLVGYLAAAFAVAYVLAQVPLGNLADRMGFRLLLTAGYLLSGVTALLYYWAGTPTLIFWGRALQGIAEVPIWALAPALLSLHYAPLKGRAMGLYNATFHLGLSAGPLLGMVLPASIGQGDSTFLVFAGTSFAGALILALFVENPQSRAVDKVESFDLKQILQVVSQRLTLVVLLGITLYGAGYGLAVTIIPAFLITAKGFQQGEINLTLSLIYIAVSLAQLVAGPLSDKAGRQGFMIGGLGLAALGLASFSSLPQPWLHGALALTGLGLGVFCVASLAYLNECVSDGLKGTISGAHYLFWGVGYFCGPLAVGALGRGIELTGGFYLLALLLGLEALLLTIISASRSVARSAGWPEQRPTG
jgi:MFS family permease